MKISEELQTCVVHFGQMGGHWGFNRTVGQMLALLIFNEAPLNADQISEMLTISRGNTSMGLKELQSWQLISTEPVSGERKIYYKANGDIWQLSMQIANQRRKREIEPTLTMLRRQMMSSTSNPDTYIHEKMKESLELLEMVDQSLQQIQYLEPDQIKTLLKIGGQVGKVLKLKDKFF
ncbi:GbsR/MarR family transcriptional regulator [Marinicellulosiphila megalodicopiae]|uniref:GbsR/MarR family transcriptional regulator n=1 Tax=Marinicellulosiphila megalodicopiae TaxID=2724896 RepID=UPI003BB1F7DD